MFERRMRQEAPGFLRPQTPYEQTGLPVELGAGRANRRSLHCAHPDFRVRSGRDDNSFVTLTFPIINRPVVHSSRNSRRTSQTAPN
jgi:hypothetical protein